MKKEAEALWRFLELRRSGGRRSAGPSPKHKRLDPLKSKHGPKDTGRRPGAAPTRTFNPRPGGTVKKRRGPLKTSLLNAHFPSRSSPEEQKTTNTHDPCSSGPPGDSRLWVWTERLVLPRFSGVVLNSHLRIRNLV